MVLGWCCSGRRRPTSEVWKNDRDIQMVTFILIPPILYLPIRIREVTISLNYIKRNREQQGELVVGMTFCFRSIRVNKVLCSP